jgi:ATP-dependent helicase/nuclease subunit A
LVVESDRVLAVDFKSNRILPENTNDIPEGLLRQMGAYAVALAQIYPDRQIETAILWTAAPRLMPLDPDIVTLALQRATIP